ncbi:MAG: TetR/AcrR family transcriptional regulator [Hyphomonas sp.]|nr:TetR/AcrR family transcriptional regulator [Hyphomonas sp.]
MKTRDRILQVSLLLFNEEGEAGQTAVDLSNALDISPGNLYYHFKGKDAIIHALFDRFEEEMRIILNGSRGGFESLEDSWIYLYVILEEIYDFRFFYRDLGVLLDRYPDLARRFRALLAQMRAALVRMFDDLMAGSVLQLDPRLREILTDQVMTTLTFWLAEDHLNADRHDGPSLIHKTVLQVMCLIPPYMGDRGVDVLADLFEHYDSATS